MSGDKKKYRFSNRSDYELELRKSARARHWNTFSCILTGNKKHHRRSNVVTSENVKRITIEMLEEARSGSMLPSQAIVDTFVNSCTASCEKDRGDLLILACTLGASDSLIRRRLNINPNVCRMVDDEGKSPLIHAVIHPNPNPNTAKQLLRAFPDMAKISDNEGVLPLHYYIYGNRDRVPLIDGMRCLLKAFPGAALDEDMDGDSPLEHLWSVCLDLLETPPKDFFGGESDQPISIGEDLQASLPHFHMLLLVAITGKLSLPMPSEPSEKKWRPVDAAVSIGCKCPIGLLNILLAVHFGHPRKRDEEGMLPLHVIAKGATRFYGFKFKNAHTTTEASLLQHVLEGYPDAAKLADNQGQLPLHISAGSNAEGFSDVDMFSESHDVELLLKSFPDGAKKLDKGGRLPLHHAVSSGWNWNNVVKYLFDAHPQSLSTSDPATGLCAFMLAGASHKCDLDTTYELLRADPSLVQSGIKETVQSGIKETVANLKRKNHTLEERVATLEQQITKLRRCSENTTS